MIDVGVLAEIKVDGTAYRVLAYDLHEALSEVSTLSCELQQVDESAAPAPKKLVGKPAVLTLKRSDDSQKRVFVGTVVQAERATRDDDVRTTRIAVAPKAWRLGKRADCRVFRKMDVLKIAKQVMDEAKVVYDESKWKVKAGEERDHTAQYRETDLDFLTRLFSEEGISFTIAHQDEKDTVLLCDEPNGLGDVEGTKTLAYIQEMGFAGAQDFVFHVTRTHTVTSDKVMLRDYNPEQPTPVPEAKLDGDGDGAKTAEVYVFPGRFTKEKVGKKYAEVLVQSLQAGRDVIAGEAGVLNLVPGFRFTLEDHPSGPLNQEYLVTEVWIDGAEARHGAGERGAVDYRYACRFRAVPTKTVKWRPPRVQRDRTIVGTQTAMTTGAKGEEIHTDKLGRVNVQYHWDRKGKNDENSSLAIRTAQLATGGSMLLPRMGWEVSVRHVEGDCDHPMVMSRMYNGLTPPPYALPEHKGRSSIQTATTPGGGSSNEIRTSDGAGSEEMFMNGSKDMTVDVKNNHTESTGANCTRTIGSNQKVNITNSLTGTVTGAQKVSVGGNQALKVQTMMIDDASGDHTLDIGGNRTMMIGGDHKCDVTADSKHTVNGVEIMGVIGAVTDKTLADFTHKVGAAVAMATAGSRSVMVGGARQENTGAVKIIAVKGGRGVEVAGSMKLDVAGAIINSVKGSKVDSAGANWMEVAGGAQFVKATNIVYEAETMLSLVMGASTLTLMPAMVAIAGVSVKLDGATVDTGAMVIDN